MQETIQKMLCRPVNWFVGDKEFSKRAPHQRHLCRFLAVFLMFVLWAWFVLSLGFVSSLILTKGILHVLSKEWAKGLGFFLFFLLAASFTWWVCKIKIDIRSNHKNSIMDEQLKEEKPLENPGKNKREGEK